ncbi:Sulfotransferase domain protein [Pseudobythopirellula maris]|uniref:Sulfotransferase domain protein n=1 Tax=Pseudobythopirellula maris TaxID=2527991 RepID=A0A5C5ZIW8_9BACT|nr:sulfotransferase [Pseudobythopirellula maris]TWT87100.1 Sulfotransferase domain protein [Pseudobythopirellula maris]
MPNDKYKSFDFQPVVIIGAARSGTNMLRDALCRLDGFATWPCDEINYVWRHRNAAHPDDELRAEHASPRTISSVRRCFAKQAARTGARFLVEKTCANSLRVPFVNRIVPEAKYLLIVRDGRDVVASALKRWSATLDWAYVLAKTRYVPKADLAYYATRYALNRLHRFGGRDRRLKEWGPRYSGMPESLIRHSLDLVCAEQWERCLTKSENDLALFSSDRVEVVTYEDYVTRPAMELTKIASFLGVKLSENAAQRFTADVTPRSIGAWRRGLDPECRDRVGRRLETALIEHGYSVDGQYCATPQQPAA